MAKSSVRQSGSGDPRGNGSTTAAKRKKKSPELNTVDKKLKSLEWCTTVLVYPLYKPPSSRATSYLPILPIIIMYGTFLNSQLTQPRQTSLLEGKPPNVVQHSDQGTVQWRGGGGQGQEGNQGASASPKQREKSPSGCTGMWGCKLFGSDALERGNAKAKSPHPSA
jgi:hypothetical protein